VNGTLAGPARVAAGGAIRLQRLWAPLAVAVALHVAILAIRPGGSTGSHVAPAAKAMAVRLLHTQAIVAPSAREEPTQRATAAAAPAAMPAAPLGEVHPAPKRERSPLQRAQEGARAGSPTLANEPHRAEATTPAAAAMPSTAATALPAAPEYALGVRLDPGPRPLDEIEPDYPDPYLREGTVVLRLLISETGHVDDVAVVRSQPSGVFEQAALDAFGKARFAPGLAAGTPVKSQITVEVRFVPINRGGRVSGRTY